MSAKSQKNGSVLGLAAALWITGCAAPDNEECDVSLDGEVWMFNGIPDHDGWGQDLVARTSEMADGECDWRTLGGLGGIPLVDLWNEEGGVAIFNTTPSLEPITMGVCREGKTTTVFAENGSNLARFEHEGDYYDALREFAERMEAKGLYARTAPPWAFEPIWETYGFEEDFDLETVTEMIPLLAELGITVVTLDSGWYGRGRGVDWEAMTGDFPVNPDTIGSEEDLVELIAGLHDQGFKVRAWWVPGVAEKGTQLEVDHPDWFLDDVESSTGETADVYLDPTRPAVVAWTREMVHRLMDYGFDGFKQDDVYEVFSEEEEMHVAYHALFKEIYETAISEDPEFAVNTCNCGIAQNFYDFPGENQLITSDPVGPQQYRRRARYLHALNLRGAAILGDHVELTAGDVGSDHLLKPGFYDELDYASIVPLGMVLETKFREDPGETFRLWLRIYRQYRFYDMEWVNIPWDSGMETYLMRDGDDLYFSFFSNTPEDRVTLGHLDAGRTYTVTDIVSGESLGTFTADDHSWDLDLQVSGSRFIEDQQVQGSRVIQVR